MNREQLTELENHLQTAARSLRAAWQLCKRGGMESTAKELADTALDVETASQHIADALQPSRLLTRPNSKAQD